MILFSSLYISSRSNCRVVIGSSFSGQLLKACLEVCLSLRGVASLDSSTANFILFVGLTSMVAAVHAYLADCTSPGSRSRIFSLGMGLLFVGMAFGPSIGSFLIHATRTPLAVFYLATAVHAIFALYVWGIVPESLPKKTMVANRRLFEKRIEEERRREEAETREEDSGWREWSLRILRRTKNVFTFLSPLSVFAPVKVAAVPGRPLGKSKRDWSLTLIGMSYGFTALVMVGHFIIHYARLI